MTAIDRFDTDDEDEYYRKLRESTSRDRTRTREPVRFESDDIVAQWPCRGCKAPVGITPSAMDRINVFGAMLVRRGERAIDSTQCVFCIGCRDLGKLDATESHRKNTEQMAERIREYKAEPPPDDERARRLMKELEQLGHPDIQGFTDAVKRRRDNASASKTAPRKERGL